MKKDEESDQDQGGGDQSVEESSDGESGSEDDGQTEAEEQ